MMQLLLSRSQTTILGLPRFKLWAKFDLLEGEAALIKRYRVRNFILSEGDFGRDFKRAILFAIPIGFIFLFMFFSRGFGITNAILAGFLAYGFSAFLIYHQIREQIKIDDLLNGRFFTCRSVVRLIAKERRMNSLAVIFIIFLEAMKTWGGEEIVEFDPNNLPEVRLIEFPHAFF